MMSAEEWTALLKEESVARLNAGDSLESVLGDAASSQAIARVQADALEAAARAVVETDHSCSHTTCSGGEEVAQIILALLPPPQDEDTKP